MSNYCSNPKSLKVLLAVAYSAKLNKHDLDDVKEKKTVVSVLL